MMISLHRNQSISGPSDAGWYIAAKRDVSAEVDGLINQFDAGSPQDAVNQANEVIDAKAERVTALATRSMTAALVKGGAVVSSSLKRLSEIETQRAPLIAGIASLPAPTALQIFFGLIDLFAVAVAFITELKLTDALTEVLGYPSNDRTAKLMGMAFAFSLIIFERIFSKLNLVEDPWAFLKPAKADAAVELSEPRKRVWATLRAVACIGLVLVLLGVGWLGVSTIVKMVPTREIAAMLRMGTKVQLTPLEEEIKHEAVLFFSLCVLISGGFLAATGLHELQPVLKRHGLKSQIKDLDHEEQQITARLDREEKPALSAELAAAGLPFLWLTNTPPQQLSAKINEIEASNGPIGAAIATASANEGRCFAAEKRIVLRKACSKRLPATPRKSTVETVEDVITRAGNGLEQVA